MIIVCALLFLSVIVCCWIRTKNIGRTKTRHAQLLDVLRCPPGPDPEPDSRTPCPGSARPTAAPASAPDKWLRTPTGWTSVPEAYQLPVTSKYGLPQLPYSQFPLVVYHGGHHPFSQCGFPSRAAKSPSPTGPGLSWSSGSRGSPSFTPRPTPSSAGLRGLLIPSESPPGRVPVQPPLSLLLPFFPYPATPAFSPGL